MNPPVALEAMTEDQLLDHAETCATTVQRGEVDLLRVAYQWAVLHDPARLDPGEVAKPGRERAKRYGGDGTAPVTEFAAASLGARIGRSSYAAARLIADAQDLAHRHPQLWGRVQGLEVRASYARHVVTRTRDLSKPEAGYVDAAVAESADGRIPWSRFETLVDAKVAAAAPEVHREKEEQARKARFAKTCGTQAHGMASFLVRADVADGEAVASRVGANASEEPAGEGRLRRLGDPGTPLRRRQHTAVAPMLSATDPGETAPPEGTPDASGSLRRRAGRGPVKTPSPPSPLTRLWSTPGRPSRPST